MSNPANKQIKTAEEAVQRDANAAFETGFAKAAAELGVTDAQFPGFYKAGLDLQAKNQAAK